MARCNDWGVPHDHTHGTTTGWLYHGCRCCECEVAHYTYYRAAEAKRGSRAAYAKSLRAEHHRRASAGFKDFTHGINGYQSYGCRCDVCRIAYSEYCTSDRTRDYHRSYADKNRERINYRQRSAARLRRQEDPLYDAAAQERYRQSHRESLRQRSRDYYRRNRDYELDRHRRKRQNLPRVPAPNAGHPWSAGDDAVATSPDLTLIEAAYLTGRSVQAVSRRRYVISLRKAVAA